MMFDHSNSLCRRIEQRVRPIADVRYQPIEPRGSEARRDHAPVEVVIGPIHHDHAAAAVEDRKLLRRRFEAPRSSAARFRYISSLISAMPPSRPSELNTSGRFEIPWMSSYWVMDRNPGPPWLRAPGDELLLPQAAEDRMHALVVLGRVRIRQGKTLGCGHRHGPLPLDEPRVATRELRARQ
jgi:hypothetical protein